MTKRDEILKQKYSEDPMVQFESQLVELGMFKSVAEIRAMFRVAQDAKDKLRENKSALSKIAISLRVGARAVSVEAQKFAKEVASTIAEAKGLGLEVPKDILDLQQFIKDYPKIAANAGKLAARLETDIKSF